MSLAVSLRREQGEMIYLDGAPMQVSECVIPVSAMPSLPLTSP